MEIILKTFTEIAVTSKSNSICVHSVGVWDKHNLSQVGLLSGLSEGDR